MNYLKINYVVIFIAVTMTQWLTNNYIKEVHSTNLIFYSLIFYSQIVVYRSLSTNIFVNLALEDWILQNTKFEGRRILLLWRNTPCVSTMDIFDNHKSTIFYFVFQVVIGRHQVPITLVVSR